jgi:hypothetical protein
VVANYPIPRLGKRSTHQKASGNCSVEEQGRDGESDTGDQGAVGNPSDMAFEPVGLTHEFLAEGGVGGFSCCLRRASARRWLRAKPRSMRATNPSEVPIARSVLRLGRACQVSEFMG